MLRKCRGIKKFSIREQTKLIPSQIQITLHSSFRTLSWFAWKLLTSRVKLLQSSAAGPVWQLVRVCRKVRFETTVTAKFYILLTVHHVMMLGKWPTWRTIPLYVLIYIFNSIHVSRTSCSSSVETNCVNTTSGSCQSVSVAVSCAGRKFTSDLHTTRPPTKSDSYQRLYWHNLSLLMMSTMCSKHVES